MLILRLIPLTIAAGIIVACTKAITSKPTDRALSSLAGSEWGFEGQDAPFLNFGGDGSFNGNGGCNNFGGSYKLNGQRLILGPIMSTKKACPGPAMQKETNFFTALQMAHHIKATHLRLVIYDENDEELLSLIRRDWD